MQWVGTHWPELTTRPIAFPTPISTYPAGVPGNDPCAEMTVVVQAAAAIAGQRAALDPAAFARKALDAPAVDTQAVVVA